MNVDAILEKVHRSLVLHDQMIQEGEDSFEREMEHFGLELRKRIQDLFEKDLNGLLNILYRLDVGEELVKASLLLTDPPQEITRLIMRREIQKYEFRRKYKKSY